MINLSTTQVIDAATDCGIVPDEYISFWNELGDWQLNCLIHLGLKPESTLLDVGCGAMRLGLKAVDFLQDGNYFGMDAFQPYVHLATKLAKLSQLNKKYSLICDSNFSFGGFGQKFDFAMAQSVFTHLDVADCEKCIQAWTQVARPNSVFAFTYLIGSPATQGFLYGASFPMRRFAGQDGSFFSECGGNYGLAFEEVPIPHPTGQLVGIFKKI